MSERPSFVVRSSDLAEEEGHYPAPFDTERLSFSKELARVAGSRSLGATRVNTAVRELADFNYEDFAVEGYEPHPAIKAPIAV